MTNKTRWTRSLFLASSGILSYSLFFLIFFPRSGFLYFNSFSLLLRLTTIWWLLLSSYFWFFFHFEICLFLLFLFVQFMPPIAPFSISHEENTGILLWIDCVVWLFVFAFPLSFSRNRKLVDKNFLVYLGSIMRMMQYTQQLLSLVYKLFEWMLSRERKIL